MEYKIAPFAEERFKRINLSISSLVGKIQWKRSWSSFVEFYAWNANFEMEIEFLTKVRFPY